VASRKVLVRHHIGAGGRDVCRRSVAHAVRELWLRGHVLPCGCHCCRVGGRVALWDCTRGPASFHPRLSRALAEASSASWCQGAHGVRLGGRWGVGAGCGGDRSWPD
jgi:hypothetical protein